jgi:hypothetical protein
MKKWITLTLIVFLNTTPLQAYTISKSTGNGAQQAVETSQWQNWTFAGTALFTAAAGIILVSMDNGNHAH